MNSRKVAILITLFGTSLLVAKPAMALPAFAKAFKAVYFAPSENDEFKKAIRKANCNICHVKGEKKDVNNEYGEKIAELIEGDAKHRWDDAKKIGEEEGKAELEKLVAELDEALTKVAEMKNSDGKKYGEILAAGELPVPLPVEDKQE
jgi:hypothetical protein